MDVAALKEAIRRELPGLLRDDPNLREFLLELTRKEHPGRAETEDRFYELLSELRRDREEQNRKWEEQNRKWDEWSHRWDEQQLRHQREFDRVHEEIMALAQKHERSIGALGSRWGLQSEKAFRDALAEILEKSFGVQVVNVNEYDENGLLLICELKSSIDKAGMYAFERKVRFYERRHQRQANRLLVISPMVDARARKVVERLGIEVYSDSTDVEAL